MSHPIQCRQSYSRRAEHHQAGFSGFSPKENYLLLDQMQMYCLLKNKSLASGLKTHFLLVCRSFRIALRITFWRVGYAQYTIFGGNELGLFCSYLLFSFWIVFDYWTFHFVQFYWVELTCWVTYWSHWLVELSWVKCKLSWIELSCVEFKLSWVKLKLSWVELSLILQ